MGLAINDGGKTKYTILSRRRRRRSRTELVWYDGNYETPEGGNFLSIVHLIKSECVINVENARQNYFVATTVVVTRVAST